jgi:hypothetical protein
MWPDWVIAFVGDGRIALLALAVIGLEALVIVVFMRSRARVGSLILTMASGAGLLGALYAAFRRLGRDNRFWLILALAGPCLRHGHAAVSRLTGTECPHGKCRCELFRALLAVQPGDRLISQTLDTPAGNL